MSERVALGVRGPTSINSTVRPPTSNSMRPSKVRSGSRSSIPSKSNSPKKLRNMSPTSPGALLRPASSDGGTSLISCDVAEVAMISASPTKMLPKQ